MDIAAVVLAELSQVKEIPRRQALRSILVSPSPRNLEFEYSKSPEFRACWIVGETEGSWIVYCPAGFTGDGSYQWGVVTSGADSMGPDDGWFTTLDQAFIGSSLWRGKRPRGFKLL